MMEPVANIFAQSALYLLIVSYQEEMSGWGMTICMALAGLLVCVGVYINGPLVLYVWLVEPCLYLVYTRGSGKKVPHLFRELVLLGATLLFFYAFVPAHANFFAYCERQLIPALANTRFDSSIHGWLRLYALCVTVIQSLPLLLFAFFVKYFWGVQLSRVQRQHACFLLLVAFIAVFPIIVSSKQFAHHCLQAYPLLIAATMAISAEAIYRSVDSLYARRITGYVARVILFVMLIVAGVFAFVVPKLAQPWWPDTITLEASAIIKQVGEGATLSAPYVGDNNPALIEVYLQRFGHINLKTEKKSRLEYLVNAYPNRAKVDARGYHLMPFSGCFRYVRLYQRNDAR